MQAHGVGQDELVAFLATEHLERCSSALLLDQDERTRTIAMVVARLEFLCGGAVTTFDRRATIESEYERIAILAGTDLVWVRQHVYDFSHPNREL